MSECPPGPLCKGKGVLMIGGSKRRLPARRDDCDTRGRQFDECTSESDAQETEENAHSLIDGVRFTVIELST